MEVGALLEDEKDVEEFSVNLNPFRSPKCLRT